jgi:hypothetical protein
MKIMHKNMGFSIPTNIPLIFAIRKKLDPRIESEKTSIYLVAK